MTCKMVSFKIEASFSVWYLSRKITVEKHEVQQDKDIKYFLVEGLIV